MSTVQSRSVFLALIVAVSLSVFLTWPVALAPRSQLIGHPGNDTWNHVWGYWWIGHGLEGGAWPLFTDLLSFPKGGTLYFIDSVQVVLSLPLQWLGGPVFAYNMVILGNIAFGGFAAWLLIRKLVGDDVAAVMGLFVYECSPHLLGQAYNGISETTCTGWLPLTLLALLRLIERPTLGRGFQLGVAGALCMLTSWYYGLFAAIGGAVLVAWRVLRQPWTMHWSRTALSLGVAGLTWSVMVMPILNAFRASLEAEDALVTRDPEFVQASLLNHNITDLLSFFRPTKVASPDLFALYGEQLLIVIYLGWIALCLGAVAIWSTRRHREFGPWIWLALVFFVFSLGPYLYFSGSYVEFDGRRAPMPFLLLFDALPIFDRISHPFRFVVGVTLSIAVVASYGLRHLIRMKPVYQQWCVVLALGVAVVAEVSFASPAHIPIPTSDARIPDLYYELQEDSQEGAIIDLPFTVPNLERAVFVWYQAAHERPVPWGLNDPMPMTLLKNRLTTTLIRIEASRAFKAPPRFPELDLVIGARMLARQGFRWVVVHEKLYPEFKRAKVEGVLTGLFGAPRRVEEDRLLVYEIPALAGGS